MCGRYDETIPIEQLAKRFGFDPDVIDFAPRYNIAPSQIVPIIVKAKENELRQYRWGLIPHWAKDPAIGHKMINARAETVASKPSFRDSFKNKRCLVPATGFYEWRKYGKTKTPMRITLTDEEPFAMAGLWSAWVDKKTGEVLPTFTIITTEANALLEPIHNRMPVILKRENEDAWLDPDNMDRQALQDILEPYPSELMKYYPVSTLVNSPHNDSPEIIEPL